MHCASQLAIGIAMSAVGGQRGPNDAGNEGVGAPGTIFTSVGGVRTLVVDNAATSSSLVGGYVRLPASGSGSLARAARGRAAALATFTNVLPPPSKHARTRNR